MGLSLTQRRQADQLQRQGRTLREISQAIGASFEQVCLSLFGGIHDWEPRIGQPVPPEPALEGVSFRVVTPEPAAQPAGGALAPPKINKADEPDPEAAPAAPVEHRPAAPRPAPPVATAAAAQVEAPGAPPALEAPRRYRLTNGAGEYLHKSGNGMTRSKDAAWSGTAPQMEEAFKRKPPLKDLDPERVA